MNQGSYEKLSAHFLGNRQRIKLLNVANRSIVALCYVLYPVLLVLLVCTNVHEALRTVAVPGISFVAVTVIRKAVNAPRPYEVLDIEPLIKKDTQGCSFPSRHVFSIFVIAGSWLYYFPAVGALLCVLGCILACIRVVSGVHFPRDVVVGAALGLACAFIGYVLVPW